MRCAFHDTIFAAEVRSDEAVNVFVEAVIIVANVLEEGGHGLGLVVAACDRGRGPSFQRRPGDLRKRSGVVNDYRTARKEKMSHIQDAERRGRSGRRPHSLG